jgi:hypothetical protein
VPLSTPSSLQQPPSLTLFITAFPFRLCPLMFVKQKVNTDANCYNYVRYKSMNALSGHCLPSHTAVFDVQAGRSAQFRTQLLDQLQDLWKELFRSAYPTRSIKLKNARMHKSRNWTLIQNKPKPKITVNKKQMWYGYLALSQCCFWRLNWVLKPKDEGTAIIRNVGNYSHSDTASYTSRLQPSAEW